MSAAAAESRKEDKKMVVSANGIQDRPHADEDPIVDDRNPGNDRWFYLNLLLKFIPLVFFGAFVVYTTSQHSESSPALLTLYLIVSILLAVASVVIWSPVFNVEELIARANHALKKR